MRTLRAIGEAPRHAQAEQFERNLMAGLGEPFSRNGPSKRPFFRELSGVPTPPPAPTLPGCFTVPHLPLLAHPDNPGAAMDDGSPKGSSLMRRPPSSNQLPKEITQTKSFRKLLAPQTMREGAGPLPPALLRPEDYNPLEQHAPSVAFLDLSVGGGAPSLAAALERLRAMVARGAKVEAVSFAGTRHSRGHALCCALLPAAEELRLLISLEPPHSPDRAAFAPPDALTITALFYSLSSVWPLLETSLRTSSA